MPNPPRFLLVAQAYDRWSPFYDSYDNPMVFMATEILRRSLISPAATTTTPTATPTAIFEFGCGTGRNLAALAPHAAQLAGCDLSDGMLALARQRLPHAHLLLHDMTQPLPLPASAYGLTLFSLTLEHIPDLTLPLREAARITRPTGRIAIIEIHPFLSLSGVAAHFDHNGEEVRMPTFPHQFEHYLAAFSTLGLRLAACREWSPNSIGNPAPLHRLKRGPDTPLAVEFQLHPPAA